ncbi:MAG TPA: putative glycoside hydrolase, partial [Gemmatimonadaceae bacterium]|nr:putative glycoside hydrolase [Gemmatimonadaceae bacterium]
MPFTLPARFTVALLGALSLLAGCSRADAGADGGSADASRGGSDSAAAVAAAERRAADSVAAWRAKFGNRVPRPDSVRALYVNGWAAGSRARMAQLIKIADETEINAFIIDIKESDTYLTYDSTGIAIAKEIGADQRPASKWLPELVDTLQAHGIYSIARIVVFKDRMLAEKKPELAIRHVNGGVWKDNKGLPWVNPYDKRVWDYNIAIAKEALDMGFSELQWDYVRFPDVTANARKSMAYPGSNGKGRDENIHDFILYSKEQLKDYQVPITADVFGLVTHVEDDLGIGQRWEQVITAADVVLPMTYPSHYYAGLYGFQRPGANPYEILRIALEDAVVRTQWMVDSAGAQVGEVMPWLEAMSIRGLSYGPAEL